MTALWNPKVLLKIQGNAQEGNVQCRGARKDGARCGWEKRRCSDPDAKKALALVASMAMDPPSHVTLETLRSLAELCLCRDWHASQKDRIASEWQHVVRQAAAQYAAAQEQKQRITTTNGTQSASMTQDDRAEYIRQVKKLESLVSVLQVENRELLLDRSQLIEARSKLHALEAEMQELEQDRSRLSDLETQVFALESENEKLKQQCSSLEEEEAFKLSNLELERKKLLKERSQLQEEASKIPSLTSETTALATENARLKEEVSKAQALKEILANLEEEKLQREKEAKSTQEQLEDLRKKHVLSKTSYQGLQQILTERNTKLNKLDEENQRELAKSKRLERDLVKSQQSLQQRDAELLQAREQLVSVTLEKDRLAAENTRLDWRLQDLLSSLRDAEDKIQSLQPETCAVIVYQPHDRSRDGSSRSWIRSLERWLKELGYSSSRKVSRIHKR